MATITLRVHRSAANIVSSNTSWANVPITDLPADYRVAVAGHCWLPPAQIRTQHGLHPKQIAPSGRSLSNRSRLEPGASIVEPLDLLT